METPKKGSQAMIEILKRLYKLWAHRCLTCNTSWNTNTPWAKCPKCGSVSFEDIEIG